MTKEEFKTKLYNTISEGIKNRIKAFDFKETGDAENDFISWKYCRLVERKR